MFRSESGQALALTVLVMSLVGVLALTLATVSLWSIKNEVRNRDMIQARVSADSAMELAKMELSIDPNPADFPSEVNVLLNNYSGITLKSATLVLVSSIENPDTSHTEVVKADVVGLSHNETKEADEQLKITYFPGHTLGSF